MDTTPEITSLSHPPRQRRRIVATSVIVVLIVTAAVFGVMYVQRPPSYVTGSLQTMSVHPGETMKIAAVYHDAADRGVDENAITVMSDRSEDIIIHDILDQPEFADLVTLSQAGNISSATEEQRRTWSLSITQALQKRSGIIIGREYDDLTTFAHNLQTGNAESYSPLLIGCPARPQDTMSTEPRHTSTYDFMVLPETPPGRYVVGIPSVFYCGSSAPSLSFELTVLPS